MESYAEAASLAVGPAEASGTLIDLDCTGLACPGPIMKLSTAMADLTPGDKVRVTVSDPGFALDAPAWASKNGHRLVEIEPHGPGYVATLRKGGAGVLTTSAGPAKNKTSMVVFSGDLDKLLAAFIIGNGALSMGDSGSPSPT